ncbi:hypothetical protein EXIGLDRAFT_769442 [Exidia glandulosa HHB12029]|uniref:ABC transporter domain-containing protein n=2 Tax=Exidia glandulosa HHB12029 TaxID=1314781 RepID=A0A165HGN4_EXIGL|nr:hypothetical protein EXIGLDRAFT_769442 [Exidia glandulosa HHB12029]
MSRARAGGCAGSCTSTLGGQFGNCYRRTLHTSTTAPFVDERSSSSLPCAVEYTSRRNFPCWVLPFTEDERLAGDTAKNAYHIIFDSAVFHEERLIDRKTNAPWRSTASRSTSRSRSPTRPQLLIPKSKACQSTPEEISARSTKPFLQEGPLTSNDTERQAIKDAGTISDFNVLHIITSPPSPPPSRTVSTRIAAISRSSAAILVVLAHLGEDFDNRVIARFVKLYRTKTRTDILSDLPSTEQLERDVQKTKRTAKLEMRVVQERQPCTLCPDLKTLTEGGLALVGERGITLSGEQRAHIALACAVYARADLYMLYDVLVAVDSHMARHVFDNVIGPRGLLGDKVRVLVTNTVAFARQFDKLLFMRWGIVLERASSAQAMLKQESELLKLTWLPRSLFVVSLPSVAYVYHIVISGHLTRCQTSGGRVALADLLLSIFTANIERVVGRNHECYILSISINRWLAIRLELPGAAIILTSSINATTFNWPRHRDCGFLLVHRRPDPPLQKICDRHANFTGSQIVEYRATTDEKRLVLVGFPLYVVEIGHAEGSPMFQEKAVNVFFPEATNDFPVAMQVSQQRSAIYLFTFIHRYDLETGACIYMNRHSEASNGIIGVNKQGSGVRRRPDNDPVYAGRPRQRRARLEARQPREPPGTAKIAANSPRGTLRAAATIEAVKQAPVVVGELSPILQYSDILLDKGELNKLESIELAHPGLQQGSKQLLEKWLEENKLDCNEEPGDIVRLHDMALPLSVYLQANAPNKVVA